MLAVCRAAAGTQIKDPHRTSDALNIIVKSWSAQHNWRRIVKMSTFGSEVDAIWPPTDAKLPSLTPFGRKLLEECENIEPPDAQAKIDVRAFMCKSSKFPLPFGIDTCRVLSQPASRHDAIGDQIASTYPLIHERTLWLYLQFLEHKGEWGNDVEKPVYGKLTLCDFVQRLLDKRCVSFFNKNDTYLLLDGQSGSSGFVPIGSPNEKKPHVLRHLLSYDEIKLSAMLSVASHSEFINEGERTNCGRVVKDRNSLEPEGVVIGMIGARMSRRYLMEFQDIVVAREQNTKENGYGLSLDAPAGNRAEDYRRIWRNFYESQDHLHGSVQIDGKRFGVSRNKQDVFDNLVMKRRYAVCFDVLLLEAQSRAAKAGKQAYIHVVGFGLGVWKASPQQEQIFLEAFEQRLRVLHKQLAHIGVAHFSWFHMTQCGGLHDGALIESDAHPDGGIRIHISKRNPAQKLSAPEHAGMLPIVSYAWDGNALPGNEFWMKMLKSTGDPSTACSTLISELHNPHINTVYCNGRNLHIASPKYGIIHISEFAKRHLEETG